MTTQQSVGSPWLTFASSNRSCRGRRGLTLVRFLLALALVTAVIGAALSAAPHGHQAEQARPQSTVTQENLGYGQCGRCSCPGFFGFSYTCDRGGCGHHYDEHY